METNRLRQFIAIVETGNLRKASELLRISHGGLSKSMRVLEEELNIKLTRPEGRGLVITDAGLSVYRRAIEFLQAEDRFVDKIGGGHSPPDELKLGAFEVFSTYFLADLIVPEFPDRVITMRELIPGRLEEQIAHGSVDFGITYIPVPRPDLDYLKVGRLQMGIFATQPNKWGRRLDDWIFCAPAIPVSGSPTRVKGLDGWPEDMLPRRVKYRVDLMESALAIVRAGHGVVYLPEFIANLHNRSVTKSKRLIQLPRPKGLKKDEQGIYLVKRKSTDENRDVKRLAKIVRQIRHIKE